MGGGPGGERPRSRAGRATAAPRRLPAGRGLLPHPARQRLAAPGHPPAAARTCPGRPLPQPWRPAWERAAGIRLRVGPGSPHGTPRSGGRRGRWPPPAPGGPSRRREDDARQRAAHHPPCPHPRRAARGDPDPERRRARPHLPGHGAALPRAPPHHPHGLPHRRRQHAPPRGDLPGTPGCPLPRRASGIPPGSPPIPPGPPGHRAGGPLPGRPQRNAPGGSPWWPP